MRLWISSPHKDVNHFLTNIFQSDLVFALSLDATFGSHHMLIKHCITIVLSVAVFRRIVIPYSCGSCVLIWVRFIGSFSHSVALIQCCARNHHYSDEGNYVTHERPKVKVKQPKLIFRVSVFHTLKVE